MIGHDMSKDAVLKRIAEFNAELEREKQRDKEAALWRRFVQLNPLTAAAMARKWATEQ